MIINFHYFIISCVSIGEEPKLGGAKGKELLKCSQMQHRCKTELFACQSFFILFLRTECLIFISVNISIKSPFATSIYHLQFPPCIMFKSLYLDFVVWHIFIYLLVYLEPYAIKQPATKPITDKEINVLKETACAAIYAEAAASFRFSRAVA